MKTGLIAVALIVGIATAAAGIARTGATAAAADGATARSLPVEPAPNRLTCEQAPAVCAPALGVSLLTLAAPAPIAAAELITSQRRPLFERASVLPTTFVRVQTPPPRAA